MNQHVADRYCGRWVAVDEAADVVANADELDVVVDVLEAGGLAADVVQRVPDVDGAVLVGFG